MPAVEMENMAFRAKAQSASAVIAKLLCEPLRGSRQRCRAAKVNASETDDLVIELFNCCQIMQPASAPQKLLSRNVSGQLCELIEPIVPFGTSSNRGHSVN
jgi:hypothetical protein